jgi:hypothetical protein
MVKGRVCIVGNSHVAAWRGGLDLMPQLAGRYTFDFFAAQSDLMRDVELRGSTLAPSSEVTRRRMAMVSGGKSEIPLAEYDHFLVVGLGFNLVKPIEVLRGFQIHGFPVEAGEEALPYLSRPCYEALIASVQRYSTAAHFVRMLRKATHGRIVLVPQPLPSESILRAPHWRRLVVNGLFAHVVALYEKHAEDLARELSAELLMQPADTLTKDSLTQVGFSHGSVRISSDMATKHPENEPYHMNANFGGVMLGTLDKLLSQ